jgi:arabinofuranosyltransferase
MTNVRRNIVATIIVSAAAVVLFFGWREFWFFTDDAFIAFRYVNNSIHGHGYVWNPEPFRPVEGYTSFLYLVVLEIVWRLLEKEPPESANYISLVFTFGSIVLTSIAVMKMQLKPHFDRIRLFFLLIVLFGLLTNTSFLTWSSSGLETAMFNFFFLAWILAVLLIEQESCIWRFAVTIIASLAYLTRPDGILLVVGTTLMIGVKLTNELRTGRLDPWSIVSIFPLLIAPIHLFWRKSFYGEWLPNTYYAKYVTAWPEAGIRYLLSYIIEYGVWLWVILICLAILTAYGRIKKTSSRNFDLKRFAVTAYLAIHNRIYALVAVTCLLVQVGYYTFFQGGDHFEWRVYSHLPPLILLSSVYCLNVLNTSPMRTLGILSLVVAASLPMPWAYHAAEKKISELKQEETLLITVSDKLPVFMRPLTIIQDKLQTWLTSHLICVRWREHQLFYKHMTEFFPNRSFDVPSYAGQYPLTAITTVGVGGWTLPNVAIIDSYGLNDYIIARYREKVSQDRMMAHDRTPPDNYLNSYMPNVLIDKGKRAIYFERPSQYELTAKRIRELDKYWEDKIVRGLTIPDSLAPFPKIFRQ